MTEEGDWRSEKSPLSNWGLSWDLRDECELAIEGGRGRLYCAPVLPCTFPLQAFDGSIPSPLECSLFLLIEMLYAFQAWLKCLLLNKAFPERSSWRQFLLSTPPALCFHFPWTLLTFYCIFWLFINTAYLFLLNLKLFKKRVYFSFIFEFPKASTFLRFRSPGTNVVAWINAYLTSLFKYVVIQMKLLLQAVPLRLNLLFG